MIIVMFCKSWDVLRNYFVKFGLKRIIECFLFELFFLSIPKIYIENHHGLVTTLFFFFFFFFFYLIF